MDRNKKILIKQQELDENNNLVMARELVDLDEKVSSIKNDINSKNNQDIVDEIKKTGEKIIENLPKPEKPTEFPKEIAINNLPDVQNVKVLNFPEQKAPIVNVEAPVVKIETKENKINTENIEKGIKESNLILKDIYKKLEIEDTEVEKKEFEKVTLVDEDGKPIRYLGGGGGGVAKYVYNAEGKTINPSTLEKQDEIIAALGNVKIDTGDIELNTDQIEEKLDTLIDKDYSTSAKQDILLDELKQKTEPNDIQLSQLILVLRNLFTAIANPSYVDKSANQMRSQVTGSLTTVSTVTTVTNVTNFGSYPADHLQRMDNMTAWATNVRSLIT